MTSTYRNTVIIFFCAVTVRIIFHALTNFTADDAFITFRYAENLALGEGFVYNKAEPVFGSSTPLYTLLLSMFYILTVVPIKASLMISLAASGITAMIIYRFSLLLRMTSMAFVPVIFYILWPRSIVGDSCGMETALFTMLITASFYYQFRSKNFYAIALATMATLCRYEGALLLIIILLVNCFKNRHCVKSYLSIPAGILLPWFAFCQFYFGSIIPHTITAKLALYTQIGGESFLDHFKYLMAFHNPAGWILLPLVIWGAIWLNKKQNFGQKEILWLVGMILFFTFSRTHLFFWYIVPIYPIYFLFIGGGFADLRDRFEFIKKQKVQNLLYGLLIGGLLVGNVPTVISYKTQQKSLEAVHKQIGDYLYAHADESAKIAAEDIGYIGYYSRKIILDRDGLVSPSAVPYNRSGNYVQLIYDYKPDWVVVSENSPISGFYNSQLFISKYQLKKRYSDGQDISYSIFEKKIIIKLD